MFNYYNATVKLDFHHLIFLAASKKSRSPENYFVVNKLSERTMFSILKRVPVSSMVGRTFATKEVTPQTRRKNLF